MGSGRQGPQTLEMGEQWARGSVGRARVVDSKL